jgi:hypothetical protein
MHMALGIKRSWVVTVVYVRELASRPPQIGGRRFDDRTKLAAARLPWVAQAPFEYNPAKSAVIRVI